MSGDGWMDRSIDHVIVWIDRSINLSINEGEAKIDRETFCRGVSGSMDGSIACKCGWMEEQSTSRMQAMAILAIAMAMASFLLLITAITDCMRNLSRRAWVAC